MADNFYTTARDKLLSEVLVDEYDSGWGRETVTVLAGSGADRTLELGHVVGAATIGAVSVAAAGGNTGNGTFTLDTTEPRLAHCQVGDYAVKCTAADTDSGTFEVFDPAGNSLGEVLVGATFANQIKFVIADGATDFAAGDLFTVTVAAGSGKVVELDPDAVDGTQYAYGVLLEAVTAPDGVDATGQGLVRGPAGVADTGLVWPSGITAGEKALALSQLEAKQILQRTALAAAS